MWLRRRRLRSLIVGALSDRDLEGGRLFSAVAASEVDDGRLIAHYLAALSALRRRGLIPAKHGHTAGDGNVYSLARPPLR